MSKLKQIFAGISDSGTGTGSGNKQNKNRNIFLALFATMLLVAAVIGVVAGVTSRQNSPFSSSSHPSHSVIKSACSSTFYPELCFSAVSGEPGFAEKVSNHRDVIELSLNITTRAVEQNFFTVEKLIGAGKHLTGRERTALHDCLETIDETLDELRSAIVDLKIYPNKKSLYQHADDLKTLISAALTNQITCLDGFSHDAADKKVRAALEAGQVHVERMCSNSLAMVKNLTDTDIAEFEKKQSRRRLLAAEDGGVRWPEWVSAADRRLLQTAEVKADVVVAADGSGDFKTVAEAVAAAPEKSKKRYVIKIKAGVYRENVEVTKKKTNLMFLGEGRTNTIITGSRNVVDGSTTFHSATVGMFILLLNYSLFY